jgi:hypothetical protein
VSLHVQGWPASFNELKHITDGINSRLSLFWGNWQSTIIGIETEFIKTQQLLVQQGEARWNDDWIGPSSLAKTSHDSNVFPLSSWWFSQGDPHRLKAGVITATDACPV